ncbi:MAG: glycosyltransferase family 4 protein [Gemmataceae bacterium]|nr:glycosyltransferase family 4 protein [Gemmataceae bacterium]
MNVVVTSEHRFQQTPDGAVWTQTQLARRSWDPYLQVFDRVRVMARVQPVERQTEGWIRADDGDRVAFAPIPYYVGPWQYLLKRGAVRRAARNAIGAGDAVILKVPSTLAQAVIPKLRSEGRPLFVEVVGDPYDVFAPGASKHPLAPFFRWMFPRQLRQVCREATGAAYVTRAALQRRYPCPQRETGVSDVEIPDEALVPQGRPAKPGQQRFSAMFLGTLAQLYKAPDVLIDAINLARKAGVEIDLVLVGDGQFRPQLLAQAERLGIADHVHFRGQLVAGGAVREELDRADLFILPSHQEGLPRAMVEAMARGLPCIGSTVGGIPELLPPEDMVPPGDAHALAAKIREVVSDPNRLAAMSARNLETARTYAAERLAGIRREFFEMVRAKTESWLAKAHPHLASAKGAAQCPAC